MEKGIVLCRENFQDFRIGEFPYDRDHSATGEYHYVVEDGYHGGWYDSVCNYTYNGTGPTWLITEYEGVHYMECMRIEKGKPHRMFPTLETGKKEWGEYRVSVRMRRLSTKGMAGLVFCLNNSLDTLVFSLEGKDRAVLSYRHKEEVTVLEEARFVPDSDTVYCLEADCCDGQVECRIDGKMVCCAFVELAKRGGKAGITADCPTQFTDFLVAVSEEGYQGIVNRRRQARRQEQEEMETHPGMRLWKKNTGHCPLPVDIDGDGRDEVLVGYTMLDGDGRELWTYPIEEDHTDEIVMGKFRGDGKGYFACVSGTEGFFIGDFKGNIVARDHIGHAQRVSVANYCPERPGFEIAVVNFWGHQGMIYLYDTDGNQLWEMENEMNGNLLTPVNWDGNGQELILTNGDAHKGGLINGKGVRAVAFPDDGHPVFCCEAIDLTGDERDELVVWDYHWMYIYTQEDNPKPQDYHPVKFPGYNASNYRGEYAYPDGSYLKFTE